MKIIVILNPYANRWKARKSIPEVQASLQAAGLDYRIEVTTAPGHATALAAQAVREKPDAIIAAGGDGTISEVVNGLCQASFPPGAAGAGKRVEIPLGILPLGTANDFVINLGLPRTIAGAVEAFATASVRWIDLGSVSHAPSDLELPLRYFDNNSAMGLEPTVTLIQQKITFIHGTPRYLLATLLAILQNPHWDVHLEWEGGSYDGPVSLVTVGNTPLTGGLFYMTPHADPADGKLTFVYGYMRTRPQVLALLPRTMKPGAGSYVEHPSIHEVHSTWLKLRVARPTPLHADGEIQNGFAQEIRYEILPGRLPVLVPGK